MCVLLALHAASSKCGYMALPREQLALPTAEDTEGATSD